MFDIEFRCKKVDAKTISMATALLDSHESFRVVSNWNSVKLVEKDKSKGTMTSVPTSHVLALTDHSAFFINRSGLFASRVADYWRRELDTFDAWSFQKVKDQRGNLKGYRFLFDGYGGLPGGNYTTSPDHAEPFIEIFEASIGRLRSVSQSTTVTEQISAMHSLWEEGVLTDQEYAKAKELFLGRSESETEQTEKALRSLKQLRDAKVLSDAEYATKKWEVLSR